MPQASKRHLQERRARQRVYTYREREIYTMRFTHNTRGKARASTLTLYVSEMLAKFLEARLRVELRRAIVDNNHVVVYVLRHRRTSQRFACSNCDACYTSNAISTIV